MQTSAHARRKAALPAWPMTARAHTTAANCPLLNASTPAVVLRCCALPALHMWAKGDPYANPGTYMKQQPGGMSAVQLHTEHGMLSHAQVHLRLLCGMCRSVVLIHTRWPGGGHHNMLILLPRRHAWAATAMSS